MSSLSVPESCLQKASAEREVGPGQARRAAACCMRDPRGASAHPDGKALEVVTVAAHG